MNLGRVLLVKALPAQPAMGEIPSAGAPGETPPTPAQSESGNYAKRTVKWNGLTIKVENPAGSTRRGKGWETRMLFDYGYVARSEGVDGDEVDVYLGPALDTAPTVFVVHQRRAGDWSKYDEDKCMVGFLSEDEARAAYLKHYDDPRFLGPITAMPVAEFVAKVKATKDAPTMIKSAGAAPRILFTKSHVSAYTKKDGTFVAAHDDKRTAAKTARQPVTDKATSREWGDGAAIESEILEHMKSDPYADWGLRVIPPGYEVKEGEDLPPSKRWDDGEETDEDLSGTSTIGIMNGNVAQAISKLKRGGYFGKQVALVFGDSVGAGEDDGERLISDAKVAAVWSKPSSLAKSMPQILFVKGHVGPYLRGGKLVNVRGYDGRTARAASAPGQLDLFAKPSAPLPPNPFKGKHPVRDTRDMFEDEPKPAPKPGKEIVRTGDPLADYWANSAGESIKRDVDAGRSRVVSVSSKPMTDEEKAKALAAFKARTEESRARKRAAAEDAERAIESGEMPVYVNKSGLTVVITPSAQKPGKFQVTRYNATGAIGDSQYDSVASAVEGDLLFSMNRLSKEQAESHMAKLVGAEMDYRDRKSSATVTESRDKLIAEHERLVDVLESPSHADDKAEAKKQAAELAEMKQEADPHEREKWNLQQIREKSDRLGMDMDTDHMRSPALAQTGWSADKPKQAEDTQALKDKLQTLHDFLEVNPASPSATAWKAKIAEIEAKIGPLKSAKAEAPKKEVDTSGWSEPRKAAYAMKQEYAKLDKLDNKAVGAFKTKVRALAKKTPEDDAGATLIIDGIVNNLWGTDYNPKVAGVEFGPSLKQRERDAAYRSAVTSTKQGPEDDNPRRKFYVTIARDGRGVGLLAGPFDTHDEAKAMVGRAREEAEKADPRAVFDAFGTSGVESDNHKPGVLNAQLGIGQAYKPVTSDDHPAPIPRNSISGLSDADRAKWIDLHRQQHELRYNDLHKVRAEQQRVRSARNKAETIYNENVAAHDAIKRMAPDPERMEAHAAAANKANEEFRAAARKLDQLASKHADLHERVQRFGAEKEKLLPGSGDLQFNLTSQRRRTEEEEEAHAKEQHKLYRKPAPRVTSVKSA